MVLVESKVRRGYASLSAGLFLDAEEDRMFRFDDIHGNRIDVEWPLGLRGCDSKVKQCHILQQAVETVERGRES